MVKAILEGKKTQTRRVLKMPHHSDVDLYALQEHSKDYIYSQCPYGKPGDLLWVRESTCQVMRDHAHDLLQGARNQSLTIYKTDFHPDWMEYAREKYGYKWKPSILMPKYAARIWLRVEDVRVERLQDITEIDAKSEGIEFEFIELFQEVRYRCYTSKNEHPHRYFPKHWVGAWREAKSSFKSLWESINGLKSWDQNPWVWVVSFQVVSTTGKSEGAEP